MLITLLTKQIFQKKNPRLMKNFSYHHRCNANREARCVLGENDELLLNERMSELRMSRGNL